MRKSFYPYKISVYFTRNMLLQKNGELVGLSIKPSYFNKKLTLFLTIIQTCEKQNQYKFTNRSV